MKENQNKLMMYLRLAAAASVSMLLLTSCIPDEQSMGKSSWQAPVSYIPPTEEAAKPPEDGEWLGPKGPEAEAE